MPRDTRVIVRESNIPSVHIATMRYGWLRWRLFPIAHRRATRIVCQSNEMMDDIKRLGIPASRLVCIPNPVDMGRISEQLRNSQSPFSGPGIHLVAAGRLVRQKGFDLLINAMAEICRTMPELCLHILGEGPEKEKLRRLATTLEITDNVVFEGFIGNPMPYFRFASLLVISSRHEGFPNAALEAMACGTPVITFDHPGGSPVVDGVNGWRVPEGDTNALAERILLTLQCPPLPRSQIVDSISAHAVENVIHSYEQLFKACAST